MSAKSLSRVMAVLGGTALVLAGSVAVDAPAASAAINTGKKVSVANAYKNRLVPAHKTSIGWTGSVSGCKPGKTSAAQRVATRTAINVYRGLAGLDPVTLDASLSAKAQRAALMMEANNTLSHSPDSSWTCYTSTGKEAAGSSNLALGYSGAKAISGYMSDPGSGNTAAGHRRWILYPPTTEMGSGSTARANALWVFGGGWTMPAGTPAWVAWPNAGYFPAALEPDGRWSLSATDGTVSFESAKVTVKDAQGTSLTVTKQPVQNGYGNNTIVFQVAGITKPKGGAVARYTVTVSNIAKSGASAALKRTYTVAMFNPASVPTFTATTRPRITGSATVGSTLTAHKGAWSPTPTTYSYRWLRSGVAIAGATKATYTPVAADRGRTIKLQVTVRSAGRVDGVKTSVGKKIS